MAGALIRQGMRSTRLALTGAVLLAVLVSAWTWGLFAFVERIPAAPEHPSRPTDAIVVLTGGSERLQEGLSLLAEKRAKKLFVSGVYRGVDVRRLLNISQRHPDELMCCVTLGYDADSTAGNARESAEWLRTEGYRSIRLVTASYHMPRSLKEFRHRMPDIDIVPHAVFPPQFKREQWWRWPGTANLILSEYLKFLLASVRHWGA